MNRWIKEIQKVTRMERDPSVGTALQEVSFWLNLERALLHIQEMRDSPEGKSILFSEFTRLLCLKNGHMCRKPINFDSSVPMFRALKIVKLSFASIFFNLKLL